MHKIPTDDLMYEIVTRDKDGLLRRDGIAYRGIRVATKQASLLRKDGHEVCVRRYAPTYERNPFQAVA